MSVNPGDRVNLTWSSDYQPILDALNARLRQPMRSNINLVARMLLTYLESGASDLKVWDVVDGVYQDDKPRNGWIGFDREKWYAYVPAVVAQLRSELPRLLAEAKGGSPYFRTPPRP